LEPLISALSMVDGLFEDLELWRQVSTSGLIGLPDEESSSGECRGWSFAGEMQLAQAQEEDEEEEESRILKDSVAMIDGGEMMKRSGIP
jgi:hypothetical protein